MKSKIILDLCGGTGAWSRPYKDAGYDVRIITYPNNDIKCYAPPQNVHGILAAPPCTHFSRVRTTPREPRNLRVGFSAVESCLRIIWECNFNSPLQFWALENPYALLINFLGAPSMVFDPSEFGDKHNKKTALWGKFNHPKKIMTKQKFTSLAVKNDAFRKIPEEYIRDPFMRKDAVQRSITPEKFAQAFFEANR